MNSLLFAAITIFVGLCLGLYFSQYLERFSPYYKKRKATGAMYNFDSKLGTIHVVWRFKTNIVSIYGYRNEKDNMLFLPDYKKLRPIPDEEKIPILRAVQEQLKKEHSLAYPLLYFIFEPTTSHDYDYRDKECKSRAYEAWFEGKKLALLWDFHRNIIFIQGIVSKKDSTTTQRAVIPITEEEQKKILGIAQAWFQSKFQYQKPAPKFLFGKN